MFTRLKTIAEIKGLRETYKALYYGDCFKVLLTLLS